ncbi:sulfurtransferase TusA family protein [Ketobacter sp.]
MKQRLNQMEVGDRIHVKTTDPGSVRDFAAFAQQVGHIIHEQDHRNGEYLFLIEKLA